MKKVPDHKLNICIVGSETIVEKTLKGFLSDLGYKVCILNASDLIKLSGTQEIDLFIAPASAAKSLFIKIHEISPDSMVLIVKDDNYSISAQEALQGRVFSFLQKPIRLSELEVTLQRLIEYHDSKT
jgi:DNA-binding NtrC family response regulator